MELLSSPKHQAGFPRHHGILILNHSSGALGWHNSSGALYDTEAPIPKQSRPPENKTQIPPWQFKLLAWMWGSSAKPDPWSSTQAPVRSAFGHPAPKPTWPSASRALGISCSSPEGAGATRASPASLEPSTQHH